MESKYLLYIDILGFKDLVEKEPQKVRRLYRIIENLHCHKHDLFSVIVFSDTILIYNRFEPFHDRDHNYAVMYLIEFAQNLLYETIGKGFYFRAVLTFGQFEHTSPKNIERFFGRALISAYLAEKKIKSTGLFIDNECQQRNDIFPVVRYMDYHYVFLTQSFDELAQYGMEAIPVAGHELEQTDAHWHLAKDIVMLAEMHKLMNVHESPEVRQKYATAWGFYHQKYKDVMEFLVENHFDHKAIAPACNWKEALDRIREGFRGYMVEPPSKADFLALIEKARSAGKAAAQRECDKYGYDSKRHGFPCGGAYVILDIDGNSKLGRFLMRYQQEVPRCGIHKDYKRRGISLSIYDMHQRQEKIICEVAHGAAMEVILEAIDVNGHIESYID